MVETTADLVAAGPIFLKKNERAGARPRQLCGSCTPYFWAGSTRGGMGRGLNLACDSCRRVHHKCTRELGGDKCDRCRGFDGTRYARDCVTSISEQGRRNDLLPPHEDADHQSDAVCEMPETIGERRPGCEISSLRLELSPPRVPRDVGDGSCATKERVEPSPPRRSTGVMIEQSTGGDDSSTWGGDLDVELAGEGVGFDISSHIELTQHATDTDGASSTFLAHPRHSSCTGSRMVFEVQRDSNVLRHFVQDSRLLPLTGSAVGLIECTQYIPAVLEREGKQLFIAFKRRGESTYHLGFVASLKLSWGVNPLIEGTLSVHEWTGPTKQVMFDCPSGGRVEVTTPELFLLEDMSRSACILFYP